MPNWWVIYAEEGTMHLKLYAKPFESEEAANKWADEETSVVIIDIAEGRRDG